MGFSWLRGGAVVTRGCLIELIELIHVDNHHAGWISRATRTADAVARIIVVIPITVVIAIIVVSPRIIQMEVRPEDVKLAQWTRGV
jgi:hypothetical protein